MSVNRLAETVGITAADAFIGNKDKEKERKLMKKAAMVGQKIANYLTSRKHPLRQVLPVGPFLKCYSTRCLRFNIACRVRRLC